MDIDFSDETKFKYTENGIELIGSAAALRKNREDFPTYDDLLKRHSEYFKVKEMLRKVVLNQPNDSIIGETSNEK